MKLVFLLIIMCTKGRKKLVFLVQLRNRSFFYFKKKVLTENILGFFYRINWKHVYEATNETTEYSGFSINEKLNVSFVIKVESFLLCARSLAILRHAYL